MTTKLTLLELAAELGLQRLPADLLAGDDAWANEGFTQRERRKLAAAIELGRRAMLLPVPSRPKLLRAHDVASVLVPHMVGLPHEEFWVVLMSARLHLIDAVRVASGGLTQCSVMPREVFRPAILRQAPAIACAHNHPSGDPTPSGEDQRLTLLLDEAARALGIRVVDHLVIGRGQAHSAVEGSFNLDTEAVAMAAEGK